MRQCLCVCLCVYVCVLDPAWICVSRVFFCHASWLECFLAMMFEFVGELRDRNTCRCPIMRTRVCVDPAQVRYTGKVSSCPTSRNRGTGNTPAFPLSENKSESGTFLSHFPLIWDQDKIVVTVIYRTVPLCVYVRVCAGTGAWLIHTPTHTYTHTRAQLCRRSPDSLFCQPHESP